MNYTAYMKESKYSIQADEDSPLGALLRSVLYGPYPEDIWVAALNLESSLCAHTQDNTNDLGRAVDFLLTPQAHVFAERPASVNHLRASVFKEMIERSNSILSLLALCQLLGLGHGPDYELVRQVYLEGEIEE